MRIWCNVIVASDGNKVLIHETISNKHLIMHYIDNNDTDKILETIKNITLDSVKEQDDIRRNVYQRTTQEQYSGNESIIDSKSCCYDDERIG